MFDANMRHLSKGHKFFCKVYSLEEDSDLYRAGGRLGELYQCTMLSKQHDNPMVEFIINEKPHNIRSQQAGYFGSWVIYEGGQDLADFINSDNLEIATKIMNP